MPKLNRIRLGHVEYNNGHSVITDETIDFHSQSTLLRMENGGGKSVLTQMLLAPYIPPRSRNFKDRKFADYFKSQTPTTILQEWVLDDNAGYFLVGMMVRQKRTEQLIPKAAPDLEDQAGEENRKLDFYVFVSEYQDLNDPVSLSSFPLKIQDGKKMTYISFLEEKKYLENLGKNYSSQFRLYNMNNAERRRTFIQKLHEFGIEQTEWEQLREFNQDESGLSRFAGTYNTEDKLVRQVLIPAAEKKLDTIGQASHMETFRASIHSYIEMMLANADTLEKKKDRENFLGWLEETEAPVQDLLAEDKNRLLSLDHLFEFSKGLEQAKEAMAQKSQDQKALIAEVDKELTSIQAEIYSQKYYQLQKQIQDLQEQLADFEQKKKKLDEDLADARLYKEKLELSLAFAEMEKDRQKIVSLETRLEAIRKTEGEIQDELEELARDLSRQVMLELLIQDGKISQTDLEIQGIIQDKKENAKNTTQLDQQISAFDTKLGTLQNIQKTYRNKENAFCRKYKISIIHSLGYFSDQKVLETMLEKQQENQDHAAAALENTEKNIQQLEKSIKTLTDQIHQAQLKLQILENQISEAIAVESEHEEILEKKRQLASELELNQEDIYQDTLLSEKLMRQIEQIERSIERSYVQSHEYEQAIKNMETGCSLDIPAPVADVMEEMGLEIQTGSELLKASRMSLKSKQKILQDSPFLPYSLIIPEEKIDALIEELKSRQIHTSSIIPILSRSAMKEKTKKKQGNESEDKTSSVRFYLSFNDKLIQPEELALMIDAQKKKLEREKAYAQSLNQEKDRLIELQVWLKAHPLTKKEAEEAKKQTEELTSQKQNLLEIQNGYQSQLNSTSHNLEQSRTLQKKQFKELTSCQTIVRQVQSLVMEYKEAVQAYNNEQEVQQQKTEVQNQKTQLASQLENLNTRQIKLNTRLDQEKSGKKNLEKQLAAYKASLSKEVQEGLEHQKQQWTEQEPAVSDDQNQEASQIFSNLLKRMENWQAQRLDQETYGSLQAKYDSLQRKLKDSEIPDLTKDLASVRQSYQDKQEYFDSLENAAKPHSLIREEWIQLESSNLIIKAQERKINQLDTDQKNLVEKMHKLDTSKAKLQTRQESQLDRIEELTGSRNPKDRSETREIDLSQELAEAQKLKEQVQNELDELKTRQTDFGSLETQTADLLHGSEETDFNAEAIPNLTEEDTEMVKERLEDLKDGYSRTLIQKRKLTDRISKALQQKRMEIDSVTDEDLSGALKALGDALDNPALLAEQLERKKELLQTILEKIDTDLKSLEEARKQNQQSLLDYVRRLCHELALMDDDTTITIRGKQRKMLSILLPEWDANEALYAQKVGDYLQSLVEQVSHQPEQIERILLTGITAPAIFNAAVSISSVSVRLYKIEENRETRISWNQAGKTSGAESFLCSFVVVAAILAYQRREEAGILSRTKRSSVMLMDNPFAKAHSPHIIEALNEMCRALHIQFIAFSAVENSAIFNAFDTIYGLRMIPRSDSRSHLKVDVLKNPAAALDERELETIELHIEQESPANLKQGSLDLFDSQPE